MNMGQWVLGSSGIHCLGMVVRSLGDMYIPIAQPEFGIRLL